MAAAEKPKPAANGNSGVRAMVFLMLALIAGASGTILLYTIVQGYKARIRDLQVPEETEVVIIAAADLYPGIPITESDIAGVVVPKKYVPKDAFTMPDLVVGRIPRERILSNEYVLPGRLADGDSAAGLNALIPPGMRAMSLNLQDGSALSGFLAPGDRVDVLVTMVGEDAGDVRQTITLTQAVPIVAVNTRTTADDARPPDPKDAKAPKKPQPRASVTLVVTPEQAELLAHASKLGPLLLVLRRSDDYDAVSVDIVDNQTLLDVKEDEGKPAPASRGTRAAGPPPSPKDVLEIIRGVQRSFQATPPEAPPRSNMSPAEAKRVLAARPGESIDAAYQRGIKEHPAADDYDTFLKINEAYESLSGKTLSFDGPGR